MTPRIRKLALASSVALGALSVGAVVRRDSARAVLFADRVRERHDIRWRHGEPGHVRHARLSGTGNA